METEQTRKTLTISREMPVLTEGQQQYYGKGISFFRFVNDREGNDGCNVEFPEEFTIQQRVWLVETLKKFGNWRGGKW